MIHVVLLRGINLGPKRRVAMADLRAWLTELGYTDVRTLLQSGNAVVRTDKGPDEVREEVEAALAEGAGFTVDCVLRTAPELRAVVDADPLGDVVTDPSRYVVSFLDVPGRWPEIDPAEYEPERVHLAEREAYFWLPNGQLKSRILAAFPPRKGEVATVRNWNTVTKLLAMAAE
ncbi:DUF1697 domain-containing protein [Actinophytocola sp.]|uniref:DUF1697 domain-containing protein n=1 Tax=Actinophytocola sp. TaxID=1872138 RepID=UPI00389A7A42